MVIVESVADFNIWVYLFLNLWHSGVLVNVQFCAHSSQRMDENRTECYHECQNAGCPYKPLCNGQGKQDKSQKIKLIYSLLWISQSCCTNYSHRSFILMFCNKMTNTSNLFHDPIIFLCEIILCYVRLFVIIVHVLL